MHASHINNLKAALPSFDRAAFDGEAWSVGGGDFDGETALSIKLALLWCLSAQKKQTAMTEQTKG
jgi:hypothetical protein